MALKDDIIIIKNKLYLNLKIKMIRNYLLTVIIRELLFLYNGLGLGLIYLKSVRSNIE